ncbi:MAG: hypothetical protein QW707_07670, partial [Candidatus Bathyarchaeia archaeon]
KVCPLCSGSMASYGGRIMKCEKCNVILDRDVIAVLNLQMRGAGFPQRAPNELIEGEGLCMSIKDYVAQNPFFLIFSITLIIFSSTELQSNNLIKFNLFMKLTRT